MIVIELCEYAEFDVPVTESVWIAMTIDSFDSKAFQNQIEGMDLYKVRDELKIMGFRPVKTKKIYVGDD